MSRAPFSEHDLQAWLADAAPADVAVAIEAALLASPRLQARVRRLRSAMQRLDPPRSEWALPPPGRARGAPLALRHAAAPVFGPAELRVGALLRVELSGLLRLEAHRVVLLRAPVGGAPGVGGWQIAGELGDAPTLAELAPIGGVATIPIALGDEPGRWRWAIVLAPTTVELEGPDPIAALQEAVAQGLAPAITFEVELRR